MSTQQQARIWDLEQKLLAQAQAIKDLEARLKVLERWERGMK